MVKLVSVNPARGNAVLGEVIVSSEKEIIEKVALANKAKLYWKEIGVRKRIEFLKPIFEEFKQRENELALLITKETGRAISESKPIIRKHLDKIEWLLNNAESAVSDEITFEDSESIHRIVFEPTGTAAVITPWNHPFGMFVWGVFPNLLVGNTVVFKISEECPLTGKLLEEIMLSHNLPKGVFSEVFGDGSIGWKLANQEIDLIWFTGSSKVGEKLFELAGKKFVKSILELGGSNPGIVFEDADIASAVPKIFSKRFSICGQSCDALKRLIVQENVFEEVLEKLKKEIHAKKTGDPENPETDFGSLAAERQLSLLKEQVKDAEEKGAEIISAKLPEKLNGAFYPPTLITNVKREMRVWREEVFGPVLPIISFKTEEEAVRLANDTIYGLGSVVFTKDFEKAERIASKIESGTVEINNASHWLHCNPFGGYKKSGFGREHGITGLRELCRIKVISKNK